MPVTPVLEVGGAHHPLDREKTTIGRSPECDVVVDADGVSRAHCEIVKTPQGFVLRDLESRNGTWVGAKRITEHPLKPGEKFRLGPVEVQLVAPEAESNLPIRDPAVTLLLETVLRAAEIDDPDEFLVVSLANVVEMTGAERGILFKWENLEWRVHRAVDGAGRDLPEPGGYSASALDKVRREGKPLYVLEAGAGEATPSMERLQLRSVMVAPLRHGEKLLGAFYIDSRATMRSFARRDLTLFEAAVNYVALACASVQSSLERRVDSQAEVRRLEAENTRLRRAMERRAQVVGQSGPMKLAYAFLNRAAPTDAPVLVLGETGTGKEAIARAVHEMSPREAAPFVVVDCGSIPETLLEAELFGYEKGAFTGAVGSKPGRLETAKGGTVFFDEIGDMPPLLQAKLLRAIQEHECMRVGGTETIKLDFRVVAATHRDLPDLAKKKEFREDLYYRLAVVSIPVPPLRERGDDIDLLADHFLAEAATAWGRPAKGFSAAARESLRKYRWPGNVRELKHRIEQATILSDKEAIEPEDLALPQDAPGEGKPLAEAVAAFERRYIARMLEAHDWNVTHTARALGISRQHLQTQMKRFALARPTKP